MDNTTLALIERFGQQFNPCGDIAPGLHYSSSFNVPLHTETEAWLHFEHFKLAAAGLGMHSHNGSQTYGKVIEWLASPLNPKQRNELSTTVSWVAFDPNAGMRYRLLIGTQQMAEVIAASEIDGFSKLKKPFTENNRRILSAILDYAGVDPFNDVRSAPETRNEFMWDD